MSVKIMSARIGMALAALAFVMAAAPAQSQDAPTDPQIAHIAYTAGDIDIKTADLALKTSQNAEVIAFANNMVSDHQAVNDQALALLKKLDVTPEDNDISKSLAADARKKHDELAKLEGDAFDKAYIENEVAYHKAVNDALSGTLIPAADNAELKALLETGLTLFKQHQTHAEHLAASVK